MALVASRFDVYFARLDRTEGNKIQKTRACVVVLPDDLNHHIGIIIVAPLTTKGREYSTRIPLTFQCKQGQIVLDQIRTVDKTRLVERLGKLDAGTAAKALAVLQEIFAE